MAPGTYELTSPLVIARPVALEAAVPGTVVLDGLGSTRVITVTSNAFLRGLNITRGYRGDDGDFMLQAVLPSLYRYDPQRRHAPLQQIIEIR